MEKITLSRQQQLYNKMDPNHLPLKDYSFDKLIRTTKEGLTKGWEEMHDKYTEKSLMLSIQVAPETRPRALQIMDLLIKVLRFKGHQLVVEKNQTIVVINGERISVFLDEKNKRVEYVDENNREVRDNHPTGILSLRKVGRSYESVEWKEGPKKGSLEDQIPVS